MGLRLPKTGDKAIKREEEEEEEEEEAEEEEFHNLNC